MTQKTLLKRCRPLSRSLSELQPSAAVAAAERVGTAGTAEVIVVVAEIEAEL